MIKTLFKLIFPALTGVFQTNVAAAMVGAAAVGAVGSSMASSNAADAQVSAAQAANSPWSAAQPYIAGEFQPAQDALNTALGMGTSSAYNGERVAGLNPYQSQGANSAAAWANGNGTNTANQFYNSGTSMMGQGGNFGSNATGIMQTAQNANPMQGFAAYGSQLAQSPYTQGMIDSANLAASRDLNETQLPSLAVSAAANGNTDSTRTGVAQAILQSQTQQNMLANASNIQGQMFNTGMNAAQAQYNTQQSQALAANQQVGQAYGLGQNSLQNGQTAAGQNFNTLENAGSVFQNQQQNQDQAAYQQFTEQQQNPLNLMGQYMNVINGKWGGPAISSVGPSVLGGGIQGALGGAMTGAGAYGQYQNLFGAANSGASGLTGGQSALNVANTSSDPIASLNATQGWTG